QTGYIRAAPAAADQPDRQRRIGLRAADRLRLDDGNAQRGRRRGSRVLEEFAAVRGFIHKRPIILSCRTGQLFLKLSILMPVYNERTVVERCLSLVLTAPIPESMDREVIIVDDCSTDGTYAILQRLAAAHPDIRLYQHAVNQGKGAAVRTAIQYATGDFSLIQDADLEYDSSEYPILLKPLLDGRADAVFGSRYMAGEQKRVLLFWHSVINKTLTLISNMFCNLNLTDMETCYKVFRTDLLK